MHTEYYIFILYLRNILPEAIFCCLPTSYFYAVLLELCYVLLWASYRHFIDRLPEAICCCLQTYPVNDVLLLIYCMCLLAFFVISVDKSQLWVYL